jgi:VWFA-related protein
LTIGLGCLALSLGGPCAAQQTSDTKPAEDQAPARLKVATNTVLVRVVVRDAQGKPVEGLQKGDFKIFDQGKEQAITQFEMETPAAPPGSAAAENAPPSVATTSAPTQVNPTPLTPPPTALPGKFIAFYFDDLNTSDADLMYARDAADHYLAAHLQPQDRVAIFTSEEKLTDFTSDPKQIHDALFKLRASSRSLTRNHDCPDLSDYQAVQITENPNNQNSDAWKTALDEATHCDSGSQPPAMAGATPGNGRSPGTGNAGAAPGMTMGEQADPGAAGDILRRAQIIVSQIEMQVRANLQEIEQAVKYTSQMPGQRSVILVSPGFLSQNDQYQLNGIIDYALRTQVVVSSLDPKGLAILMRESDASRSYASSGSGEALRAAHSLDSQREFVATNVLAEIAEGTGGDFFHNSNDLKGGFGVLAGSPVYYALAFAPTDIKPDGKFHTLKVTLNEKEKGFSVQARRGYFAPTNEAPSPTEAQAGGPSDAEAPIQEQIREVILSKTDSAEIPVELVVKPTEAQGATRELFVSSHLDAKSLPFQKDGDRNLNTVMFFFAVFDKNDKLLNAQMRRAKLNVSDGQLPELFRVGLDVNLSFQLKTGTYRIREVVTEAAEKRITAFSRNVSIP